MKITISGKGIHRREITGIEKLRALPSDWYAFTNLELIQQGAMPRQVDVVIVLDDRIIVADIKDWHGTITSDGDRWFQNGRSVDTSPVKKIFENARILHGLLGRYLSKLAPKGGAKFNTWEVPLIEGCVILTGRCDFKGISEGEKQRVFPIDEFCRVVQDSHDLNRRFAPAKWVDKSDPFTAQGSKWRTNLASFFGAASGYFRPQDKRYGDYRVVSDATYEHPRHLYAEYDAEEVAASRSFGLLRLWDFSKADARYASEEGRADIAGREQDVIAYLVDRQPDLETALIRPKVADPEKGIHYWEVFERRRQLRRLREFIAKHGSELPTTVRMDFARTLLSHAAAMHRLGAAHLDIGSHSVWMELPSTIRLSHLVSASYPTLKSLGDRRYEFLACGTPLPEDVLGGAVDHFRKDVFLLGAVVHMILFGASPRPATAGDPPDWNEHLDSSGEFGSFYGWFKRSLDHAPDQRFANAQEMLDSFNEVSKSASADTGALERLQRFRKWKNILELSRSFPVSEMLKETERVVAWRSDVAGRAYLVKTWRRGCWGDERAEAPRLVRFCETAEDLILSQPPGVARVLQVGYLSDHLVLIQEYILAPDLALDLETDSTPWKISKVVLPFVSRLALLVKALHEGGRAHGDLKPQNILVMSDTESKTPILVDLLDFGPANEGEIHTPAYSPLYGVGALERDRFAVLKIAEDIFTAADVNAAAIQDAIRICREEAPRLATLDPLIEAIEVTLRPAAVAKTIKVGALGVASGALLRDEGRYYVCVPNATLVTISGASEELALTLDRERRVRAIRRRSLEQTKVALAEKRAAMLLTDDVAIDGSANDFLALEDWLRSPAVSDRLFGVAPGKARIVLDPVLEAMQADEQSAEIGLDEDGITDSAPEPLTPVPIDVPALWRTLIEVEQEQFTEGVADADSFYSRERRRHFVAFQGRKGTIDFSREDRVEVQLLKQNKAWVPIGILDLDLTRSEFLAVDASSFWASDTNQLCNAGAELRFRSGMEMDSRSRRDAATARILKRESVIPDLIDYFDPVGSRQPTLGETPVSSDSVQQRYGLNSSQAAAFVSVWTKRPLGLLQGPPGTGKTRFIAAIVHHALSTGMARNVLLASQSHEAVNNAAESVLRLFHQEGEEPSLVRVGQEGQISDALKPYHSAKIETGYREQFRAGLKDRFRVAGKHIGVPDSFTDDLYFLEATVWPVFSHMQALLAERESATGPDDDLDRRAAALRETLITLATNLNTGASTQVDWNDPDAYDSLVGHLSQHHGVQSADHVRRLRAIATLARDWVGSISSRRRSFEEFLANTRQIVCGTCVGLGRAALGLAAARFDLVVVDEAARCTPSELAVPLQSGRWILLVGDHLQLEPFHVPAVIRESQRRLNIPTKEVTRSEFERAFGSTYGKAAGETLLTQYRMLPQIGRLVSDVFYDGRLNHGRTEVRIPAEHLPILLQKELVWIATDGLGERAFQARGSASSTSWCNPVEADAIVDMLRRLDGHQPFIDWLHGQPEEEKSIGIICTYSEQRELIRRKLVAVGLSGLVQKACKIDTVDSYQGKQNTIVIVSLVRNNVNGPMQGDRPTIAEGFMSRMNRINVALSRAMDRLVIVGASERWPMGGAMARVAAATSAFAREGTADIVDASELTLDGGERRRPKVSKKTTARQNSKEPTL